MAEEEKKEGVIFAVGNQRILFSDSSVPLSAEDKDGDNSDESSLNDVEGKCESEPASPKDSGASGSSSPTLGISGLVAQIDPKTHPKQWSGFLHKFKKAPSATLHTFNPGIPSIPSIKKLTKKKSKKLMQSMPEMSSHLDAELYCFEASWTNYSLKELKDATNNFSRENIIGEGGYSEVYKGHLQDGQIIAVKRLIRGTPEEMTSDFLSELGILVHVNHPNISNVIGYGVEGGMHLVLPLSHHGSLASLLSGQKEKLDWRIRYNIALGTASGLSYLHEGCQRRIIHRDIKAANILLSEDFEPRISDFGLAKWLPDQWMHLTVSEFEGTFGYLAPEVFTDGLVDEKTDVYAYGVLLLEIITGRPALDESMQSLIMWAKPLINTKNFEKLLDPHLAGACNLEQLNDMVWIASQCINEDPTERPKMSQIYRMLSGDEGIPDCGKKFIKRAAFRRRKSSQISDEEHLVPQTPVQHEMKF
ncbi:receptor-like cytosolic serine/threonine-protein kinase RBK2 isoform X1 [Cynara cardunculus var. scolymus]|uniref:non-specific serine/threonine protein kinase n=1 Tax=Cynara cardunculus var. scolymus TaxID=59895 RepID=A0A124SB88_CYNCS|nr:receptor-like cytosolic serine/threonine-protein kinase RBK2 isoform X1 [Cynara cardunculus var. scolymus]XP_024984923.1 receptor-like cytosolic serine/threonine-protein kinase RBK2 isoform X1 [Cynara cardunculus var. scolymus]XP_024984924.1 receptor-like cytosolic serine/threonine-protein kinase RBK2 isoform X1 [Cynara cardunculus var. scolymus]XP_024984925.1 receptor-like cytosolic serine/threonine-protein kinase RBK2 isoform X1 [Cynara cardunculus var. scolymus]KVH89890.1 Protein kinase, 